MKALQIKYGFMGEEDVAHEIEKEVITFDDLKFYRHRICAGGWQAVLQFPHNGYGISVVNGEGTYSSGNSYEVAILHNGELCYNTPLTDDVLSYETPVGIDNILETISTWSKDQWEKREEDD